LVENRTQSDRAALALKLAEREAALARGIELIEWTFDPLDAGVADFNFAQLGVIVQRYEGETDRFVAEWHLRRPHVERRISSAGPVVRDGSVAASPLVNPSREEADGLSPGNADLEVDARRLLVEVPANFREIQRSDPSLAAAWRQQTRQIFQTYLTKGYRVVDFFLSDTSGRGHYLLAIPA
jgi:predicted GNAT superfamily acetyltransferase